MSTVSKLYSIDVARQMARLGVLERLYTGRPRWKLGGEGLPPGRVDTFPVFQTVYEALPRLGISSYPLEPRLNWLCHRSLDRHVARSLPAADVLHALAYCGLETGREARRRGIVWVCDSPTPHLSFEHEIVAEEAGRLGLSWRKPEQRFRDYAEASYAGATAIVVGSEFAGRTFAPRGVPADRVFVIPYGADLGRFAPRAVEPAPGFGVLFVGSLSIRKGVHDLVAACHIAGMSDLTLTLAGAATAHTRALLSGRGPVRIEILGSRPKSELSRLYSSADVLVLPSICDGFGLVIGEALACGCPVIATDHTGGHEVIRDGVNGFVVPARAPEAIADRLVWLREHPEERRAMRDEARRTVSGTGGWDAYGDALLMLFERLFAAEQAPVGA
jgi:glycosyltransferase involved in cell wall biosynthesis